MQETPCYRAVENPTIATRSTASTNELLETDHTSNPNKPQQPLTGAIVCLSGLTGERKKYISNLIQDLGGRYSSILKLRQHTHLITSSVTSEKYKAAKEKAPNSIRIVTPDWVEACAREYMWVEEAPFLVTDDGEQKEGVSLRTPQPVSSSISQDKSPTYRKRKHRLEQSSPQMTKKTALTALPHHLTSCSTTQFQQIYDRILLLQPCSCIFSRYEFFVISIVTAGQHPQRQQQQNLSKKRTETAAMSRNNDNQCLKILHKLIRHGLGTRYEELHQDISHLLVITDTPYMERNVEYALKQVVVSHPRRPSIVTPEWIIACLTQGRILSPHDYPLPPPRPWKAVADLNPTTLLSAYTNVKSQRYGTSRYVMGTIDVNSGLRQMNRPKDTESTTLSTFNIKSSRDLTQEKRSHDSSSLCHSSSIFGGLPFVVVQQQNLSNERDIVSFDVSTIRSVMEVHGAQLLTESSLTVFLETAKEDYIKQKSPVICYLVVLGAIPTLSDTISKTASTVNDIRVLDIQDPALLTIASDSCAESFMRFQLVTPLWVTTCVEEKRIVRPEEFLFFQPLSWNMKRLFPIALEPNLKDREVVDCNDNTMKLRVAVSGFVGAEREGLLQTLQAIGTVYTDSLKQSNTHLICKVPEGAKYKRAKEWGIHIVTVDWLYHIARYGYFGKNGPHDSKRGLPIGCEGQFSLVSLAEKN